MNHTEEVAQLSLGDSKFKSHSLRAKLPGREDCNGIKPLSRSHTLNRENTSGAIAAVMRDNDDDDAFQNLEDYPRRFGVKPCGSYSVPIRSPSHRPLSLPSSVLDDDERARFIREIEQAKDELIRFRNDMNGLAKQMNGMAIDLKDSKDRVCTYAQKLVEIEHDLTATQEVNVDLQVLLEKAVKTQKESDGQTTNMIRNMHLDLASIVHENSQLKERLTTIAAHQRKHQGNVLDVGEKMREYALMLEQAQGTIQLLQGGPRSSSSRVLMRTREDIMNALSVRDDSLSSRRASDVSSIYLTEDEEVSRIASRKPSETTTATSISPIPQPQSSTSRAGSISPEVAELYRHRIIRRRTSLPDGISPLFKKDDYTSKTSPQQGLRLLLRNQGGHGLGLSSLTDSKKNRISERE